jgi:DNA invertase Pin-like site-specific DNA recombinase
MTSLEPFCGFSSDEKSKGMVIFMQKSKYKAAVYVRLSKEDGDFDSTKAESNSISNQKSLIMNFLKEKEDIEVVSIREDDGYSGSSFDRPAFRLMMEDVENGKVNCIVVKDLSRFGREYIDTGKYIERLFPALGVRFIAINDGYDSADTSEQSGEILIPFKNLINDTYCRDISVKIRSHLEVKRQNGEYVSNYCPYGYVKSETDKNQIVPDEFAGHVVQDIYSMIKSGMSLDSISRRLNEQGVPSPMQYKILNGSGYQSPFYKSDKLRWHPLSVRRIATNPIYMGTLIQGKRTTPNHKIKKAVQKREDKWAVVEHNHEPIVSERDFRVVQRLLMTDMRTDPKQTRVYAMSGIAVCADCGALMTRKLTSSKGKRYAYYICSKNKKTGECTSHRIREEVLEQKVLLSLQEMIGTLVDAESVIKQAGAEANIHLGVIKCRERIEANEEVIRKYNKMLVSLFEDYRAGIVSREDFQVIKSDFDLNKSKAEKSIEKIEKELAEIQSIASLDNSWMQAFKENKNITKLDRNVIVDLIDRVLVSENGDIQVVFDCDDKYRELVKQASMLGNSEVRKETEVV